MTAVSPSSSYNGPGLVTPWTFELEPMLRAAEGQELKTVLEREAAGQERLGGTEGHCAAVRAFLAGQQPFFSGR
ncbi:hypothetical protein [Streptomyces sp. NPDC093544]|uniref:hypothetical protein n=1 Tax=Streptomyces sp. NPDC093544 TaxID=3155200 RepID=UPI00341FB5E5